jgi:hypothetical protein
MITHACTGPPPTFWGPDDFKAQVDVDAASLLHTQELQVASGGTRAIEMVTFLDINLWPWVQAQDPITEVLRASFAAKEGIQLLGQHLDKIEASIKLFKDYSCDNLDGSQSEGTLNKELNAATKMSNVSRLSAPALADYFTYIIEVLRWCGTSGGHLDDVCQAKSTVLDLALRALEVQSTACKEGQMWEVMSSLGEPCNALHTFMWMALSRVKALRKRLAHERLKSISEHHTLAQLKVAEQEASAQLQAAQLKVDQLPVQEEAALAPPGVDEAVDTSAAAATAAAASMTAQFKSKQLKAAAELTTSVLGLARISAVMARKNADAKVEEVKRVAALRKLAEGKAAYAAARKAAASNDAAAAPESEDEDEDEPVPQTEHALPPTAVTIMPGVHAPDGAPHLSTDGVFNMMSWVASCMIKCPMVLARYVC